MTRSYASPIFQHRHYAELAAVLAESRADAAGHNLDAAFQNVENAMVRLFKGDNSRFQPDRFRAAAAGKPINGKDRR